MYTRVMDVRAVAVITAEDECVKIEKKSKDRALGHTSMLRGWQRNRKKKCDSDKIAKEPVS